MDAYSANEDVPITVSNPIALSFKPCDNKQRRVTIMDLQRVIMVEIISRLPIKSIFRCKCVCKCWYNLPSDPLFVNMYHTRSSPFPCLFLTVDDSVTSIFELEAHYDYDSNPLNRPITLFPTASNLGLGFVKPKLKLIGSCNGFICLSYGKTYAEDHSVYISNPLLGEYFKLKLPKRVIGVSPVAYGFCFSEASGKYKILRWVTRRIIQGGPLVTELEVYTIGVDVKWRNVGRAPCPLYESFDYVNVNGSLQWLYGGSSNPSIISFDVGTEKVKSLRPPPGLETEYSYSSLMEMVNCLCWTIFVDRITHYYVDIWRMKEHGTSESWTKCIHINLTGFIPANVYKPIVIWKDGEILMQSESCKKFVSYNPKGKQFREVRVYGGGRAAARYAPSFYSLKTVMAGQLSSIKCLSED